MMIDAPRTVPQVLLDAAAAHGDMLAIVSEESTLTYAELRDRAVRAAALLRARGVGRGDRVAIWLPNSAAWVEAALGAFILGATVVPISTRLRAQEAAFMLRKSAARALVAAGDFLGVDYGAMIEGIDLPDLKARIRAFPRDGEPDEWAQGLDEATPEDCVAALRAAAGVTPDDVAEIMFTSGTTGFPKGAMLRHGQIVRTYSIYSERAGIRAGDRYLIIAPMFHSFGFKAGVLAAIIRGATMYPVKVFDAAETLRRIEAEGISVMGGPPTIFSTLLEMNRSAGKDLSSLRSIVTGASMVSPNLIRALQSEVGVEIVVNAYGLTEVCALVTMTRPDDAVETIATTAGRVIDGVEMRLVDTDGNEVPVGAAGEIEVRGFNVMAGYLDDPAETEKTIRPDGWLRTGDVGVLNEDGCLRVTDRIKDMFIVGGFNCYPAEIEKMMLDYPGIREVAVIGVPDERMGEVAKALVVAAPDRPFDTDAFIAWCRANMANYKVPRHVELLDALPRNAMGKIQKFLLREADA